MEKLIKLCLIFLFISFLVSSCVNNDILNKKIELTQFVAYTNYYDLDSLQKKADYYPPRMYVCVKIQNPNDSSMFLPMMEEIMPSKPYKSGVVGVLGNKTIMSYITASSLNTDVISPKDTAIIELVFDLDDFMPSRKDLNRIQQVADSIQLVYIPNLTDTIYSKEKMPTEAILIRKGKDFKLNYLDRNRPTSTQSQWR